MSESKTIRYQPGCYAATWIDLEANETGAPADIPMDSSTRTVQIWEEGGAGSAEEGSGEPLPQFIGSANVTIQGSLDGKHWFPVYSMFGQDKLTQVGQADIFDIAVVTRYLRPVVKGGNETTRISVAVLAG